MQDYNEDNLKTMVSDEEIDAVWGNADFGGKDRREVIGEALLKYASRYTTGKTSTMILVELGLLNEKSFTLTKKGGHYLWAAYSKEF